MQLDVNLHAEELLHEEPEISIAQTYRALLINLAGNTLTMFGGAMLHPDVPKLARNIEQADESTLLNSDLWDFLQSFEAFRDLQRDPVVDSYCGTFQALLKKRNNKPLTIKADEMSDLYDDLDTICAQVCADRQTAAHVKVGVVRSIINEAARTFLYRKYRLEDTRVTERGQDFDEKAVKNLVQPVTHRICAILQMGQM